MTEESLIQDGMNSQTKSVIRAFQRAHENVKIELEILPHWRDHTEEREVRLEQIRAEIMAGKGPDGYLLPNYLFISDPMFNDVQQAMRNGVFADISAQYDADETLGKENLMTEVMDAGVVNGARYVLPLRYDVPILYADTQLMEEAGMDLENASSDLYSLLDEITENGSQPWFNQSRLTTGMGLSILSYLPDAVDYDTGEILINAEELTAFLYKYQDTVQRAMGSLSFSLGISSYIETGEYLSDETPIKMGCLSNVMSVEAIARAEGREVTVVPLRAVDGDLTAGVTYYAAVGTGSAHPELVYQFLREFLTEESQFEQNRLSNPNQKLSSQLISGGLPVRMKGFVEEMWEVHKTIYRNYGSSNTEKDKRRKAIMSVDFSDADFPVLDVPIDRVYFTSLFDQFTLSGLLAQLNDIETGKATDVDVEALAEEMLFQLQLHVAEG